MINTFIKKLRALFVKTLFAEKFDLTENLKLNAW